MHQTQCQIELFKQDAALLDRMENAVLSVNPDLWLCGALLAALVNWLV